VPTPRDDVLVPGFDLPPRPAHLADAEVAAWSAPIVLPTYLPTEPDRYPAYLDRRVYQGSSGRVFPLPFHDRISETPADHSWTGLHLENAYVRLLVLPELGGRIQLAVDKRTGYPLFYANPVIKPALVGLAGPWLAGGVEFNWPQHHRPATNLPTAWEIDETDGTLWCSDHDPFARMKGMHGVRLRPDSTVIELRARLFNRDEQPQTFLWWANVAAEVHDDYQSFFPSDVTMVADHAKRAVTTFPAASIPYYGVDYAARRAADSRSGSPFVVPGDRLDWPRNIPVPTSYMCVGSRGDFFGGYDHRAEAGFVHWADRHYAVGKKQWTWGDDAFGRTWNRNLADGDAVYIELMAGVFTDNQPDFSHLAPGETKTFSQHWYPVAGTGVVVAGTLDLALGRRLVDGRTELVLDATRPLGPTRVSVTDSAGTSLYEAEHDLNPDQRVRISLLTTDSVRVLVGPADRPLLRWDPAEEAAATELQPAVEPLPPAEIATVEELYLIGRHLEQYRHATRSPEPYWVEALVRDPGHVASHVALGTRRYREARYAEAEGHARTAITRLTRLNPNPEVGDAHYLLGLSLTRLGRDDEAYEAFAKATWLDAFAGPANHQLALIDARHRRDEIALQRVDAGLRARLEQLQLRDLAVVLLRRLGRDDEARRRLDATLALDPLDVWARQLAGTLDDRRGQTEAQTLLDVAQENAHAGNLTVAVELAERARRADAHRPLGQTACAVLADYLAASWLDRLGDHAGAAAARGRARRGDRTWNFASRLDDVDALQAALRADPDDPTAAALLGHWCYAHGRATEALVLWRHSAEIAPDDPVVWRNIAVAAFNVEHDAGAATTAYERALVASPADPRLLFESDQLLKRIGASTEDRLERLAAHPTALGARDDLAVEHAQLLLAADRADEALAVLDGRRFQPWEGGEGLVLRAWERTRLALARQALVAGDPAAAVAHVRAALDPPATLGESRHPLANPAALLLALGDAADAAGLADEASAAWRDAAEATGDFSEMSPLAYSENTYSSVLAARRRGDASFADLLADGLRTHVEELGRTPAVIDYFATSLPSLLLFDDDPQRRRDLLVGVLRAQLALLDDDHDSAATEVADVLAADPSHELALDLRHHLEPTRSLS
jgi:tetratricopeptide (TPR) repeat protein